MSEGSREGLSERGSIQLPDCLSVVKHISRDLHGFIKLWISIGFFLTEAHRILLGFLFAQYLHGHLHLTLQHNEISMVNIRVRYANALK